MNIIKNNELQQVLKDYFGDSIYFSNDYVCIVENIVIRMLDDDSDDRTYEKAIYAIDDELIYYNDRWTVVRYWYVDPKDVNYEQAINNLLDDCITVYERVKE